MTSLTGGRSAFRAHKGRDYVALSVVCAGLFTCLGQVYPPLAGFTRPWPGLPASGWVYPPLAGFIRLWLGLSASGWVYPPPAGGLRCLCPAPSRANATKN